MESNPKKPLGGWSKKQLDEFKAECVRGEVAVEREIEFLSGLAERYKKRGQLESRDSWIDLLKAHALFNTCALKCESNCEGQNKLVKEAFDVQVTFWEQYKRKTNLHVTFTFEEQLKAVASLKSNLETIRRENDLSLQSVKNLIESFDVKLESLECVKNRHDIASRFIEKMCKVSRDCNSCMQAFTRSVITEAFKICGGEERCPCAFEVLVMGSMAKGECTPYSDVEYLFLVEESTQNMDYFVLLAVTSYFLIGSLQETKLAHLNIQELCTGWYRDTTPAGYQIDGITSNSGNIPTGGQHSNQPNKFIKTVDEMVEQYQNVYDNPASDAVRGDFSAMLANTALVFQVGDCKLHSKLNSCLQQIKPNSRRMDATMGMLRSDVERHNFLPDENFDKIVRFKGQIYRYPSIMIHDLKVFFESECQLTTADSYEIAKKLFDGGKISDELREGLLFILYSAQFIRLATYHYFKSQKDDVSLLDSSEGNVGECGSPYYPPRKLIFLMFLHMIPVKMLIRRALETSNPAVFANPLPFDTLECAAVVHYYSGRFGKFLECTQRMAPTGYADLPMEKRLMSLEALRRCGKVQAVLEVIQQTRQKGDLRENHDKGVCLLFEAHCDYEWSRFAEAANKYKEAQDYFTDNKKHSNELALCFRGLGLSLFKVGNFCDGELCFEKEREIFYDLNRQSEKQNYEIQIAGCHINIAICQEGAGMYARAEDNLLEAKDIYWKLRGPNTVHREASMLHLNLGNLNLTMRNLPKAIEHYKRALEMDIALHPSGEHADIARDFNNLGVVFVEQHKFQEASDNFRKSLKIHEKMHPDGMLVEIACRYRNLATVSLRLGKYEDAEGFYTTSLEKYKKIFAETPHQDIGDVYTGLAKLYYDTGDKKRAGEHYGLALDIFEKVYGDESAHPKIAAAYNNACYACLEVNQYEKAESYARKSLKLFKQVEKPSQLDIANCYDTLAEVYERWGKMAKAREFYEQCVDHYEETLKGNPNQELARSYTTLGTLLEKSGLLERSYQLHQKSLNMYEQVFSNHPEHHSISEVKEKLRSVEALMAAVNKE